MKKLNEQLKINTYKNADIKTWGVWGKIDYKFKSNFDKILKKYQYKINLSIEKIQHKYLGLVNIPYTNFLITTKCTFRCKHCSDLIQYFNSKNHFHITYEQFKKDVDALLLGVNNIKGFCIIGGEPFLHKDIVKMAQYVDNKSKIQRVYIFTNGTIIPDEQTVKSLSQCKKLCISISDYRINPKLKDRIHYDELGELFKKYKIKLFFKNDFKWFDMGNIESRGRTREENLELYKKCNCYYNAIFNGKLHVCPRSANLLGLGDFNIEPDDYVDLRNIQDKKDSKEKLINFYSSCHPSPCEYCNSIEQRVEVMPAEQLTAEESV